MRGYEEVEESKINKLPAVGGGRRSRSRNRGISPGRGGRLGEVLLPGKVC